MKRSRSAKGDLQMATLTERRHRWNVVFCWQRRARFVSLRVLKLMKRWLFALATVALAVSHATAQVPSFGEIPVEINAESQRFVGGVAVAEGNVEISYGPTTIYADFAQYNPDTRDVLVVGNVRIYREGQTFVSERALYNLETKQLRASDVRGEFFPFQFAADSMLT